MMSRGTSPFSRSTSSPGSDAGALGRRPGRDSDDSGRGSWLQPGYRAGRACASLGTRSLRRRRPDVERVLLASPRASAPAWRWRSRRWPGWSAPSSRPSTATTRSSTTSWSSTGSRPSASCSSTRSPRCPTARPIMLSAHGSAPEVVDGGPRQGQLRRRQRVPAGDQGPPRGQGARRQGLPHRLRRPRRPRGGGRHDGGRARGDPPRRVGRGGRRAAASSTSPVALLAQTTLSHRDWADVLDATRAALPGRSGRPGAPTSASPRPTASRR